MKTEITAEDVDRMYALAREAHAKDTRKGVEFGEPYIAHPERIASMFDGDDHECRFLAYGHDIYEDHPNFFKKNIEGEYPGLLTGFYLLSREKDKGEGYFAFICRIAMSGNLPAILVKIGDLLDNLNGSEAGSRMDKYLFALNMLLDVDLIKNYVGKNSRSELINRARTLIALQRHWWFCA